MKKKLKLIALVLAVTVVLSGCGLFDILLGMPSHFSQIQYTRPDMAAMDQSLEDLYRKLPEAKNADQIMDAFWPYYQHYANFVTQYQYAFIRYSQDMTDIYWDKEYNYCLAQTAEASADYDKLLRDLAASAFREELEGEDYFGEDFFDGFEGESLWDETMVTLLNRENDLLSQYYALSAQPQEYTSAYFSTTGAQMEEIFLTLVSVRQQMAAHAGYDDYPTFAYDFYHNRDYSADQAMTYMEDIRDTLAPLYTAQTMASSDYLYEPAAEADTFAYTEKTAKAMGGKVWECFRTLDSYGLYDISYGANKYPGSFEVFLYNYGLPFVFVDPLGAQQDKLTFTHEFGHFCNDFVSQGTNVGTDVSETFSQGLEYLSLFYGPADEKLKAGKLAESLRVFVSQSVYAVFEHRVYELTGDALTAENVRALYRQTTEEFTGIPQGWDSREYVLLPHLYSSPLYLVSYVVSNDAAMQLYLLEAGEAGAGRKVYEENLDTEALSLLAFLEEAGLESPFAPGHLKKFVPILQEALLPHQAA